MRVKQLTLNLLIAGLIVLVGGRSNYAQQTSTNQNEIYRSAVEAALRDREITEDEESILEALRASLNLSKEEANQIKSTVLASLPKTFDQSGRWEFVLQNIALGVGLYGWGIPTVLDVDDVKWYVGGEMLSLGTTYYLTYQVTKKMEITHARAHMFRAGAIAGLYWGNTITNLVDNQDVKLRVGLMMLGAPVGMLVTDRHYLRWQPSLGQSWSLTQWSEIAANALTSIHKAVEEEPQMAENIPWQQWDEYQREYDRKHQRWENRHAVLYSLGLPAGLYLGHRLYGQRRYSLGDGLLLTTGRLTGLLYSVLLWDLLVHPERDFDSPAWYLFNSACGVGGIVATDRLIRGKDYTAGQAILTAAGGVSGGLFGAGLGVIFEVRNSRTMDLLALGGSLGGFYLANRIMNVQVESQSASESTKLSFVPFIVPAGRRLTGGVSLSYNF